MRKIIDILNENKENNTPIYSFEIFPPRTEQGMISIFNQIKKISEECHPQFIDVTWGAGGSTANTTLQICKRIQDEFNIIANLHITCTNVKVEDIKKTLDECKQCGINNILCLRGDPPKDAVDWVPPEGGFTSAAELVKWVRQEYGDYFCISVAGYPEGHPSTITVEENSTLTATEKRRASVTVSGLCVCKDEKYEQELNYLKSKVDNGADFVITQMFFDSQMFLGFVDMCRAHGINCPILPGLLCPVNYSGFYRMVSMNKSRVPSRIWNSVLPYKEDEHKIREEFIQIVVDICQKLIMNHYPYLHFFILNTNKIVSHVLTRLDLIKPQMPSTKVDSTATQKTENGGSISQTSEELIMQKHTILSNSYDVTIIERHGGIKPLTLEPLEEISEKKEEPAKSD